MARKLAVLAVALVAAAALAFVGWQVLADPPRADAAVPEDVAEAEPPAPAPAPSASLAQAPAVERPPEEIEVPAVDERPRASAMAESVELEHALWVEGRVVFPPRTPPDEELSVLARGKRFETIDYHRAEVAPDGTFRVAFEPTTTRGRLLLKGHYLHAPSMRVDLADLPEELVLEPQLGGRLSVVVRQPADLGPDDPFPPEAILHAQARGGGRADARGEATDGVFELEVGGLVPHPEYTVRCTLEGWVHETRTRVAVGAGEHVRLELQLVVGARIEGRVVDAGGAPLAGVRVRARTKITGTSTSTSATSSEDGSFVLVGVAPGEVELSAGADGYRDFELDLGELADRDERRGLTVELDSGHSIAGRVLWPDGRPAAGAHVKVEPDRGSDPRLLWGESAEGETDEEGTFHVAGLKLGTYSVVATAARPAPEGEESIAERRERRRSPWVARLVDVDTDTADVVLVLSSGNRIAGTVVDDNGMPLDDFVVVHRPADSTDYNASRTARFKGADGAFVLEGLAEGEWLVHARSKEHGPGPSERVRIPGGADVRLVALRHATVHGSVVETGGLPVENARVRLSPRSADPFMGFSSNERTETTTDEDGRFELDRVPPGSLRVSVESPGHTKERGVDVQIAPGEDHGGLTIELSRGGRIEGRLHERPGLELGGHRVDVNGGSDSGGYYHDRTYTDERGRFVLEHVAPGTAQLQCEHELGRDFLDVEVVEDATVEVVLGLPKAGGIRLFGTVTRAGRAVEGVRVIVGNEQPITDASGGYQLVVEEPGDVVVSLREASSFRTERIAIVEAAEQRLDFALASGSIAGRVLTVDGSPAPELTVQAVHSGEPHQICHVQSDEDGAFRMEGLEPGRYTLSLRRIMVFGLGHAAHGLPDPVEVELGPDQALDGVVLRLTEPCLIEGKVTLADGSPAVGAQVMFARDGASTPGWSRTDASGRYSLNLEAGTWQVTGRSGTLIGTHTVAVEALPGGKATADLVLAQGTAVQVVIEGVEETIHVTLTGEDDRRYSSLPQGGRGLVPEGVPERGRLVGPLPPGTYRIAARRASSDRAEAEGTVTVNGEPFREVVLAPAGDD